METRKIQLAGGTTYTVSLPKEWASEHDLESGAQVRVYPHADGSLLVRTNGADAADRDPLTVSAVDRSPEALRRHLRAGYEAGRDAIAVTTGDDDHRRTVRDGAQALLGVDVVEETDSRVVCKSLLDAADVSVEQSLRQLQFVGCATSRDAVTALVDGHDDLRRLRERRAEARRLRALVGRQFERSLADPGELDALSVSRSTLYDYDAAARQLERVAAHATTVATVARRREELVPEDHAATVETTANEVCDLVETATDLLLDGGDAGDACDVLADRDRIVDDALDRGLADDAPGWLALVVDSLAATADCGGAIADVALRAAARPE